MGADYLGNGRCKFVVWALSLKKVELKLVGARHTETLLIPMDRNEKGYWKTIAENISVKTLYLYRLEEERDRPDPASHFQPKCMHEPSQIIDHNSFNWEDQSWRGIDISEVTTQVARLKAEGF